MTAANYEEPRHTLTGKTKPDRTAPLLAARRRPIRLAGPMAASLPKAGIRAWPSGRGCRENGPRFRRDACRSRTQAASGGRGRGPDKILPWRARVPEAINWRELQ